MGTTWQKSDRNAVKKAWSFKFKIRILCFRLSHGYCSNQEKPHYRLSHFIPYPPACSPLVTIPQAFLEVALFRSLLALSRRSDWPDFLQISLITDTSLSLQPREPESVTLKMEEALSSETPAHKSTTHRRNPEDGCQLCRLFWKWPYSRSLDIF